MTDKQKVLVAGASGVVGFAAVQHFAARPGWEVVGVSRRVPDRLASRAELFPLDLADAAACEEAGRRLGDVTHLVYAALHEKPGIFAGWRERDQMERNLAMFANLLGALGRHAPGLRHVTLLQGTKAYGAHVSGRIALPARERAPRHQHENFYWLQEDHLLEATEAGGNRWTWTILRPQIIFGEAFGSNLNPLPALGVYAAARRLAGLPLAYPGGVPTVSEAVDADLLARAMEWAATSPQCAGEAFNITNGDVFEMRELWPAIADAFGMEVGEPEPMALAGRIPELQRAWDEVVAQFDLVAPPSLDEFVGQSFLYADVVLGAGQQAARRPTLVSTIKARQAGFGDCVDTEDMFRRFIARFQDQRIFPPRAW
jgi:nucleoside-diphosphate-sugar epimerase